MVQRVKRCILNEQSNVKAVWNAFINVKREHYNEKKKLGRTDRNLYKFDEQWQQKKSVRYILIGLHSARVSYNGMAWHVIQFKLYQILFICKNTTSLNQKKSEINVMRCNLEKSFVSTPAQKMIDSYTCLCC